MSFTATVDHLAADYKASSRCLVFLDRALMEQHAISPGDLLRVASRRGRSVMARAGNAPSEDQRPDTILLDRFLRQALKVCLNEEVEVEKVPFRPVKRVSLVPAIDLTTMPDLTPYVKQTLVENQTPVAVGSVLYIPFPKSVAGTTYRVHSLAEAPGVVTEDTEVRLEYHDAHLREGAFETTFEDVGGLDSQIRILRELVQLPLQFPQVYRQLGINPPRGIIFYGPAGTGKTLLARSLANEVQARFYYINGPDIVGTYSGETEANLRRIFAEAGQYAPSIILIDELDAIAPKRGQTGAHSDTRAVTQLLALMDGLKRVDAVMVIGTTNRIEAVDPALRRPGRFDREVFFGPPDPQGRWEILQVHTREMPLSPEALGYLPELARITYGFVGADLMELCREAGLNALRRSASHFLESPLSTFHTPPASITVERSDFEAALRKVRPSALRETLVSIPDVRWEDIGGLWGVKEKLRELVQKPLENPRIFAAMDLPSNPGVLLYGPPGTGKTLLAKAVANQCGVNFIAIDGPEVFTKWLGESEEAVRHVFRIARQVAPSILFFDQLDAIAPLRGEYTGSKATERVVSQLLTELDGIEPLSQVMVIGATNKIELVDPSMLRPGRFGIHLHIPLPDMQAREEILRIHLRHTPLAPDTSLEQVVKFLAPVTEGFSGAQLVQLCQEAKLCALRQTGFSQVMPLRIEHFQQGLAALKEQQNHGESPGETSPGLPHHRQGGTQ